MSEHEQAAEKGAAEATPPTHPLFSREIRPLHNWTEWLVRWYAAVSMEEMLGLLHVGFGVPLDRHEFGEKVPNSINRLIFYFSIADGWEDHALLKPPGENHWNFPDYNSLYERGLLPSQLRQKIARKAFDTLCLAFFKEVLSVSDNIYSRERLKEDWKCAIVSERLFPVIQNFFRAEKERYGDNVVIRNLSRHEEGRSHNERLAARFLLALARLIWDWEGPRESYYSSDEQKEKFRKESTERRSRIDASKPWLVEVLSCLDKLDLLSKREWLIELDKPCLAKLKEIALWKELHSLNDPVVVKRRHVATVNEALYAGSKAALLLKEYEIVNAEHKRLTAILDAERQRAKAERELEKLTGRKK